jgi:hypothetical protein
MVSGRRFRVRVHAREGRGQVWSAESWGGRCVALVATGRGSVGAREANRDFMGGNRECVREPRTVSRGGIHAGNPQPYGQAQPPSVEEKRSHGGGPRSEA